MHLETAETLSRLVREFELDDEAEPAPVYRAMSAPDLKTAQEIRAMVAAGAASAREIVERGAGAHRAAATRRSAPSPT